VEKNGFSLDFVVFLCFLVRKRIFHGFLVFKNMIFPEIYKKRCFTLKTNTFLNIIVQHAIFPRGGRSLFLEEKP